MRSDNIPFSTIRHLTPRLLSERLGASQRWWQRYLPEMYRLGVVSRKGRLFWGRLSDVESWLASTQEASNRE